MREGVQQKLDELLDFIKELEHSEALKKFVEKFKAILSQINGEEVGQVAAAMDSLSGDSAIYQDVGKLVREYHEQFRAIQEELPSLVNEENGEEIGQMKDRLLYVIEMTEKSANTTMDIAEKMQEDLGQAAQQRKKMLEALATLKDNEGLSEQGLASLQLVISGLEGIQAQSDVQMTDLGEILMAQNYQDLTGQIIHKVAGLMQNLEQDLAKMIERYGKPPEVQVEEEIKLQGPFAGDNNTRADQVDVDSLLAEHGF